VSVVTAASVVAATLNQVGLALELVGATLNEALIRTFGKVVLMAMMLSGRPELPAVMLPFTRRFRSQ
jgi:Trk-type K+ transport system membrane component